MVLFFAVWVASILLFLFLGVEPDAAFSLSNYTSLIIIALYIIWHVIRRNNRRGFPAHDKEYLGERTAGVLKCDGCGANISLESPYEVTRKPLIGKPKVYCPSCASRRNAALLRKNPEKARRSKTPR